MHRLVLALALVAPTLSRAQSSGWQYTTRITVDSGKGAPRTTTMRHVVTAAALRIEIGGLTETYTITNEADSTTIMIMPGSRMATIMPIIRASASTLRVPAMTPHLTAHTTEDLGPGEPILGHATRHYRMTTQGTMDVTFEGQTCSRAINDVAEMWTASDVDLKPALDLVLRHSGSSLADALSRNTGSIDPDAASRGFPLRTVFRRPVTDSTGATRTVTTTAEYTEIFTGTIDDALFRVPSDYRQMDMRRYADRIKASSAVTPPLPWKAFCSP